MNTKLSTSGKEKEIAYWDTISAADWINSLPPWRANTMEQKILEEEIKKSCLKTNNCKVALLGSTPEIRSFLAKQHLSVNVVDYSANMYAAMSKFSQVNPNENYFKIDWLSYFKRQEIASYDIVLGDLVFRLLSNTALETLLKYIARSLKNNGKLLFRTHLGKKHNQVARLGTIIKEFEKTKLPEQELIDRLFFPLSEYFSDSNDKVNLNKMKIAVNKYRKQAISKKSKQTLRSFVDKWMSTTLSFYVRDKSDIDTLMSPQFELARQYPSQYDNLININVLLWRKSRV